MSKEITIAEVQSCATLQREECGVEWYTSNEYYNLHYLVQGDKVYARYGFWARTLFNGLAYGRAVYDLQEAGA
jgi:hypothetical protein